jgi:hypothetical protein
MVANASILEQVIDSAETAMTKEAALFLLGLSFPPNVHARYEELSQKAAEGSLGQAEQQELDDYLNADCVISLLKSKARRSFPKAPTRS